MMIVKYAIIIAVVITVPIELFICIIFSVSGFFFFFFNDGVFQSY